MKARWRAPWRSYTLVVVVSCSAAACGGEADQPGVGSSDQLVTMQARKLSSGEIQTFDSVELMPDGWVPCMDKECTIPPAVPCQNVGPTACVHAPECHLRTIACWYEGAFIDANGMPMELSETGASQKEAAGTVDCASDRLEGQADSAVALDFMPPSADGGQRCVVACESKVKLACTDYQDAATCGRDPSCEWEREPIACAGLCAEGATCSPCVERGICRQKRANPAPCVALDEFRCAQRLDCEWMPPFQPILSEVDDPEAQYRNGPQEVTQYAEKGAKESTLGSMPLSHAGQVDHLDSDAVGGATQAGGQTCDGVLVDKGIAFVATRPYCQPRERPTCPPVERPTNYPCGSNGWHYEAAYDSGGCLKEYRCLMPEPSSSCSAAECASINVDLWADGEARPLVDRPQ